MSSAFPVSGCATSKPNNAGSTRLNFTYSPATNAAASIRFGNGRPNTVTNWLRLEAAADNAAHNYLAPAAFYFARLPLPFCLVWVAHIAFDRVGGYGLKHLGCFKQTHLGQR